MKKTILLLLITFLMFSCHFIDKLDQDNFNDYGNIIEFVVTNSSNSEITDLEIFLTDDTDIKSEADIIVINENRTLFIDMDKADSVDGSYSIRYKIAGEEKLSVFGYYTNGYPLDESIDINLTTDGIE